MRDPVVVTGLTILIVAGIFLAYPATALIAVAAVAAWYTTKHLARTYQARTARDRALIEHADHEHALIMAGDERGVWGQYPPVKQS